MELITKKRLHLISGRSNLALAEEIADNLGVSLGEPNLAEFANGEIHCRFAESVRGSDVFIIQSHTAADGRSINDSIMEQLIMVDAARRASAKRITVVCPFYGYARQDRKAEGREPITARLLANMFSAAVRAAWSASICTRARSRGSSTSRSTTSPRCRCWSTHAQASATTSWSCLPMPVG